MSGSSTGFILLDSSLNLIASNQEAVRILAFPTQPEQITRVDTFVRDKVRSQLAQHRKPGTPPTFVAEFRSGNRRYCCAAYSLEAGATGASKPGLVLLLERTVHVLVDVSRAAAEFELTPRERETVEHLVRGLTTKEIAERMKVSPSTVNAFLRLVMVKVGVSNRSAVVHRILRPSARSTHL